MGFARQGLRALRALVVFLMAFPTLEVRSQELQALMETCSPAVHPVTMAQIVRQESGGQIFAISDDGPANLPWSERKKMLRSFSPTTMQEAAQIVAVLTQRGHLVGIGLTQISNRHLASLGLTAADALDPCKNLWAGSQVLVRSYQAALGRYGDPSKALVAAISAYNTGDYEAGIANGYVRKVISGVGRQIPELKAGRPVRSRGSVAPNGDGVVASAEREARFAPLAAEGFQ